MYVYHKQQLYDTSSMARITARSFSISLYIILSQGFTKESFFNSAIYSISRNIQQIEIIYDLCSRFFVAIISHSYNKLVRFISMHITAKFR